MDTHSKQPPVQEASFSDLSKRENLNDNDGFRAKDQASFTIVGYLNTSVDSKHMDLIVLAGCFVTGLTDTVMYNGRRSFLMKSNI